MHHLFFQNGIPDMVSTQSIFNEFLLEYQRFEKLLKQEEEKIVP